MFISAESDVQRLPVALLTGFLGSGKTTLLNALLRHPRAANTAVAVNEFGEIPLDSHLIDAAPDQIVTLANGCLCCNIGGDMQDSMMRLFASRQAGAIGRFDRLVIEPSGLSDPAPIAQAILRNPVLSRMFRLETIICTVDALFAERHFSDHAETRKQAALADRIVITKSDMVDADAWHRVHGCVRAQNPLAPVFPAGGDALDVAAIFPASWLDISGSASAAPRRSALFSEAVETDGAAAHAGNTTAVCLATETGLDWNKFDVWLRGIRIAHADQLLRIKGVIGIAGAPAPVAIHGIHHVLHVPVQMSGWPDGITGTRIVMITRDLPPGTLERLWASALPGLAAPALRQDVLFW
jgi:G3E family GTPase